MSDDDRAGEFGPIYLPALQRIHDLWLGLESLVDTTSYDDVDVYDSDAVAADTVDDDR